MATKTKTKRKGKKTVKTVKTKTKKIAVKKPKAKAEGITYIGTIRASVKAEPQNNTRDAAASAIAALRRKVGELYGNGKIVGAALTATMVDIDNAVYYMCSGLYDQAIDICDRRETIINGD
jgi:hypothetical protein